MTPRTTEGLESQRLYERPSLVTCGIRASVYLRRSADPVHDLTVAVA